MPSNVVEDLFKKAMGRITEARTKLEGGAEVDLSGLDKMVNDLCSQVSGLAEKERVAFVAKINEMMGQLNAVSALLKKQHAEIKRQLESLNTKKQAATAYKTADYLTKKEGDDQKSES